MSTPSSHKLPTGLGTYLNDHLMGAAAGSAMFDRAAHTQDASSRDELSRLSAEVAEDKDTLVRVMRELGVTPMPHREILGSLGEKLGRLKPNGTLFTRSPTTDIVEIEGLIAGVNAKAALWRVLAAVAADRVPGEDFEALEARAHSQAEALALMHTKAAGELR